MKIFFIIIPIIFFFLIGSLFFFYFFNKGMKEIKKLIINDVELSKISDGIYTGKYHKGRWTYDVQVTVNNHRIVKLENLNKEMEEDKSDRELSEKIATAIIEKQSILIDAISGATINTKAYQKAVENALTNHDN